MDTQDAIPTPPTFADRSALLQEAPRRFTEFKLPVRGLMIRLRSLTELEKSRYERAIFDMKGNRIRARLDDSKARLIALCAVDAQGRTLFTEADVPAISAWDSAESSALFDFLWEFLGFEKQPAEDLAKN